MTFSTSLQNKITKITTNSTASSSEVGGIKLANPLIFAPMAGISNKSYRRLMEELGAGATVSELISAKAICYKNNRTTEMLKLSPAEINCGLQLFGDSGVDLAEAAKVAMQYNPKFIDLNLGCPVRKVVGSGAGSALLREPQKLGELFKIVRQAVSIPLTIKIRTGWDSNSRNAGQIINIAAQEGIDWVAIHGRTRSQQYRGRADWDYLEQVIKESPLPIIANGDLHSAKRVREKLASSKASALMVARGALRFPFIFLETFDPSVKFLPQDYAEVLLTLGEYLLEDFKNERIALIQLRKHAVWFAAGYPFSARFRQQVFQAKDLAALSSLIGEYFSKLGDSEKQLDLEGEFLTSGHG